MFRNLSVARESIHRNRINYRHLSDSQKLYKNSNGFIYGVDHNFLFPYRWGSMPE